MAKRQVRQRGDMDPFLPAFVRVTPPVCVSMFQRGCHRPPRAVCFHRMDGRGARIHPPAAFLVHITLARDLQILPFKLRVLFPKKPWAFPKLHSTSLVIMELCVSCWSEAPLCGRPSGVWKAPSSGLGRPKPQISNTPSRCQLFNPSC